MKWVNRIDAEFDFNYYGGHSCHEYRSQCSAFENNFLISYLKFNHVFRICLESKNMFRIPTIP